jgi:CRISPR-associated protein (TIGR02710 family)
MCQAMIISLGGTPEPLARSIAEHRPAFICFFASHDSVERLGQVRELLAQGGLSLPPKHIVLAEDVNDLVHCYEKALECARLLAARDIPPAEVVVDYTGGTKTMTAALALATVGKGYRFSYVGGEKRNKEGLGVVESGSDVVHTGVSPWQIFAVEEWQHLVLYVRQYQYEAALTLVSQTRQRLPGKEQLRWQGLEETLEGLLHWEPVQPSGGPAPLPAGHRKT